MQRIHALAAAEFTKQSVVKGGAAHALRYGSCLLVEEGDRTIGELSWEERAGEWYIHMLQSSRPKTLLMLIAQFRTIWRDAGKPMLRFDVPEDRAMMLRLVARYGLRADEAGAYQIPDPDNLELPTPHVAAQ